MSSSAGTTDLATRRASREAHRVHPAHARSWQLVNALHADRFDPAQLGYADAVLLDIEDAVDDSQKKEARDNVVDWLSSGGRAWIRINDVTTPFWEEDVAALAGLPGLAGVMLAKAEAAEQVAATYDRLGGAVPVVPLVESAVGIEEAVAIAKATGAFRLAFGGGDYRKDTGAENTPLAMAYPRSRLVVASRIGGLTGPVDNPTISSQHAVIREQCADAVALGMTGKLCLDSEQPALINEEMSPSAADVAWAYDFLAAFEAEGGVIKDGSYKPRLARATVIKERAAIYRISPPAVD
jgi:citrate lyase subunit beta / citryl-CoA lyase